MKIDRVCQLSTRNFTQEYLRQNKPVVITDALRQWTALGKWSLDYFKKNYGDKEFTCRGNNAPSRLDAYIDSLQDSSYESPVPYMRNINVQPDFMELLPDISPRLPYTEPDCLSSRWLPRHWLRHDNLHQLFISGIGTTIPLHFDDWMSCNFISNLVGVKEFTFYRPEDGPYLSPKKDDIIISEITNIYDVDKAKFPLFAKATPYVVELGPGESLFVPSGWWHTSLTRECCISISSSFVSRHHWHSFSREMRRLRTTESPFKAQLIFAYLSLVGVLLNTKANLTGEN